MMSEKGMRTLVTIVSVVLAISGMVVVGFFVLWALSFQAWGSSK